MNIHYNKNHTIDDYSEIILEIKDTSKDRIKNIDKLEKELLKVLSKVKGE